MFAILVLMALFTTFMTTPAVMAIHKPVRCLSRAPADGKSEEQQPMRIQACIHGPDNMSSLIDLIRSLRPAPTDKSSLLKLYVMHLVELTDRCSAISMVKRTRKNGFPFINGFRKDQYCYDRNQIMGAFQGYCQLGRVAISHLTSISILDRMHEDISHVATEKKVSMIILPFHKHLAHEGPDHEPRDIGHRWRDVARRVLETATCSVAVLIDRRFNGGSLRRVGALLLGGPEDQQVLQIGARMAQQKSVQLTLVKLEPDTRDELTALEDDASIAEFMKRCGSSVHYEGRKVGSIEAGVLEIGKKTDYDLLVIGKGEVGLPTETGDREMYPELGPIGDMLASFDQGIIPSILVIQHPKASDHTTDQAKLSKLI